MHYYTEKGDEFDDNIKKARLRFAATNVCFFVLKVTLVMLRDMVLGAKDWFFQEKKRYKGLGRGVDIF